MSPISIPPHLDSQRVEVVFEALNFARENFLRDLDFKMEVGGAVATGVSFDEEREVSLLFVNPQDSLACELEKTLGSWRDAWILILAHESGHVRLNSICGALGEDPTDPDAQLKAMGIHAEKYASEAIADFQKETAIESYCDACAANAALELFGKDGRKAVEALREIRARTSAQLGFFQGDEYATQPALDEILKTNGKIEPADAAKVAFEVSLRTTTRIKKMAVAAALNLPELKSHLVERLRRRRQSRPSCGPSPPRRPQ